MITQADLDHHIRRERYHREASMKTTDPGARKSHIEMAESHARRIQVAEKALAKTQPSTERDTRKPGSTPPQAAT